MTAQQILELLRKKHSDDKWVFLEELRNQTGFKQRETFTDAVAIGLWQQNKGIIAYEIKVSRSDFIQDVAKFQYKHKFILEVATEFYYVCPNKLIQIEEVPESVGLKWVSDTGMIITKKVATQKPIRPIPFPLFCSVANQINKEKEKIKLPVKFLGQEISQKEFNKLVEEKVTAQKELGIDYYIKNEIAKGVNNETRTLQAEKEKIEKFFSQIKKLTKAGWDTTDDELFYMVIDLLRQASLEKNIITKARDLQEMLGIFLKIDKGGEERLKSTGT